MSETSRTPLKPAEIRRRAFALIKQCWKTLLIAAVLMSLLDWTQSVVKAYGEKLATEAYNDSKIAFLAENPPPEGKENSEEWAYYRDWMASYKAEESYDAVYAPWKWAAYAIDLVDLLFTCVIAVRLCRGLLSALRGGECTPHCLLSGWERTSTACWLAVQTTLRVLGWSLLPLIIFATPSYFFGDHAATVGSLLMTLVAIWASLHYALAEVHLADAPDSTRTASDCLRLAVDDADAFGIWQMCRVLWPLAVIFAADAAMMIAAMFLPALNIPAEVFDALSDLPFIALLYTCYVCIYDEMRQRVIASQEAAPADEGLARARALATQSTKE